VQREKHSHPEGGGTVSWPYDFFLFAIAGEFFATQRAPAGCCDPGGAQKKSRRNYFGVAQSPEPLPTGQFLGYQDEARSQQEKIILATKKWQIALGRA
jgi:hypothetical protein